MRKQDLDDLESVGLEFVIKSVNEDKRIVTGEVYAPNVIDTHGEMMLPEDIELLAHRFMVSKLTDSIDVMHDNVLVQCNAVESFLARPNDPDYSEGSWVLAVKIDEEDDSNLWPRVKSGDLNGFSIEMMVRKVPAIAEIEVLPSVLGYTELSDGHQHIFYARISDDGRVTGGSTSEEQNGFGENHSHQITFGTATDEGGGHSHRFFLP